jgi:hypothetical protein
MTDNLYVPVVREDQPLDVRAVIDLPKYLDDPDDAAVTSKLLQVGQLAGVATIGELNAVIESCTDAERKTLGDLLRRVSGVTDRRREREREQAERAARVKQANNPSHLVPGPTGWYDPAEQAAEALRTKQELASRARQLEHEQAQRRLEAEASDEYKQALAAQRARELPEHLR